MDYQTALKMKYAGFKFRASEDAIEGNINIANLGAKYSTPAYWHTTLEEVLEALGEVTLIVMKKECLAINDKFDIFNPCKGSTPLIACCNLYLAINSK